ncbi:MAG TPA: zf-HC2 domain-containing protein [Blastocatellia bacterium]|nr:zf-HC2 domain-containing protein [Blastocatellia bacterium]
MDHDYIEQFDLVDQYLMGRLASEESARFEEHFVDCPQCLDRLKTTGNFIHDLKLLTAQEAIQSDEGVPKGPSWSSSFQPFRSKPLALAASFLLLVTIAGALLMTSQIRRLRSEVNEAKSASAEWERRYEEERSSASLSDQKREEAERSFAEQLRTLEARLAKGDEPKTQPAPGAGAEGPTSVESGTDLPIHSLHAVRGGGESGGGMTNEIALPGSPSGFGITIPLEGDVKYKNYRVTIFSNNRVIWKKNDSKPNRYNSLSMVFNSALFRPGNFLLTVEGVTEDGGSVPVGNYPFRITRDTGNKLSP